MKGKPWIVAGILCFASAILIVVVGIVFSVTRFDMQQVVMPGTAEFEMTSPGKLNLAYEPRTVLDGVSYASPVEPNITFHLESLDGGGKVTFRPPLIAVNYSLFGQRGHYIGVAELDPGRWRLVGVAPPGDDRSGVYAYGRTSIVSIVIPIVVVAIVGALLAPIGVCLLIVGIVLHVHGRKKRTVASPTSSEG